MHLIFVYSRNSNSIFLFKLGKMSTPLILWKNHHGCQILRYTLFYLQCRKMDGLSCYVTMIIDQHFELWYVSWQIYAVPSHSEIPGLYLLDFHSDPISACHVDFRWVWMILFCLSFIVHFSLVISSGTILKMVLWNLIKSQYPHRPHPHVTN